MSIHKPLVEYNISVKYYQQFIERRWKEKQQVLKIQLLHYDVAIV